MMLLLKKKRCGVFATAHYHILTTSTRLASYLMRNATDAEDVVQEWGPAMKPWLLAILRNVCNAEFARRARGEVPTDYAQDESVAKEMPTWQEPHTSPDKMILQQQDSAAIRQLVTELPEPFREAVVLREINELSYKEIAEVAGVPVGTVMSRLARARAVLRSAWNAAEILRGAMMFRPPLGGEVHVISQEADFRHRLQGWPLHRIG
jgi:RNA polymerase sigma factor (sigma-70 family)